MDCIPVYRSVKGILEKMQPHPGNEEKGENSKEKMKEER
jgi:hypothetical protein